jgi:hypothetical protein
MPSGMPQVPCYECAFRRWLWALEFHHGLLVVVKDGPHCITWTHAPEVNSELVNFLGKGLAKHATAAPKKEAVA